MMDPEFTDGAPIDSRRVADAIARQNLYFFVQRSFTVLNPGETFIPNWHIDAMCAALEKVFLGETKRLLITVPPRHLKSICTTIGFCAWAIGRNPSLKIMTASYSGKLADQHSHDFRRLVEHDSYRRLFPTMIIDPRGNRVAEIKTTRNGGRYATSRGGAVTGFGADMLIVDDLMKAEEARSATEREAARLFFEQTLLSRLNDKGAGAIIVIQQRLHEDDIAGYLIEKGGYEHLNLPAIADAAAEYALSGGRLYRRSIGEALFVAREPLDVLEQLRRDMGAYAFSAQYLQNPIPPDGGHVRWEWFGVYDAPPLREALQSVIQSWDTAMTADPSSDYSVCMTFGLTGEKWLLLDVFRRRLEFPELVRAVTRLRTEHNADRVLIEQAGAGISLLQELRSPAGGRSVFLGVKPRLSKEERFFGQTAKIERGEVLLPADAPWLAEFKRELIGFPSARYDDQTDCLSQFLQYSSTPRAQAWLDTDPKTRRRLSRRRNRN